MIESDQIAELLDLGSKKVMSQEISSLFIVFSATWRLCFISNMTKISVLIVKSSQSKLFTSNVYDFKHIECETSNGATYVHFQYHNGQNAHGATYVQIGYHQGIMYTNTENY